MRSFNLKTNDKQPKHNPFADYPRVPRSTQIAKKKDIKIALSPSDWDQLAYYADKQRVSMTHLATTLLTQITARVHEFEEVEYKDSDYTVHVKADINLQQTIDVYKRKWRYRSTRKAAHRILMQVIRGGMLG